MNPPQVFGPVFGRQQSPEMNRQNSKLISDLQELLAELVADGKQVTRQRRRTTREQGKNKRL